MEDVIKAPDKKQEAKDCRENNKQLKVADREIKQMLKGKRCEFIECMPSKWVELNGFDDNVDYFLGKSKQIRISLEIINHTKSYCGVVTISEDGRENTDMHYDISYLKPFDFFELSLGDKDTYIIKTQNMRIKKIYSLK